MDWSTIERTLKTQRSKFRVEAADVFSPMPSDEFFSFYWQCSNESERPLDEAIEHWLDRGRWPAISRRNKHFLGRRFDFAIRTVRILQHRHHLSETAIVGPPLVSTERVILEWLLLTCWCRDGHGDILGEALAGWAQTDARFKFALQAKGVPMKPQWN